MGSFEARKSSASKLLIHKVFGAGSFNGLGLVRRGKKSQGTVAFVP
jgi:hypothetical protein